MEDFISGTEAEEEAQKPLPRSVLEAKKKQLGVEAKDYPWEAPGVRDDVIKIYNLRLPEPYLLKLKYISEHTPASMQKFCIEVLLPAIDAKIEELTAESLGGCIPKM
jgi:hypothetical protein